MALPARLQEIVEEVADLPAELRLEAVLVYPRRVPPLPERLAGHREAMEQVPECQTPFFLATELGDGDRVTIPFEAPPGAAAPPLHPAAEGPAPRGVPRHPVRGAQRRHRRRGPGRAQRLLHRPGPRAGD